MTFYCKDCLRHNCEEKMKHPMQIARIDANLYCGLFWNPQSEPAFSGGATKKCKDCKTCKKMG